MLANTHGQKKVKHGPNILPLVNIAWYYFAYFKILSKNNKGFV